MGTPRHIARSASQLFYLDKEAVDYKACLAIADVPHPDRATLASYFDEAADSKEAARCFFRMTTGKDEDLSPSKEEVLQFSSNWKRLIKKFRPVLATSISDETKRLIYERDGGRCELTGTLFKSPFDHGLQYVHIISPSLFMDPDLAESMLSGFLPERALHAIRLRSSYMDDKQPNGLDNLWLLSTPAFHALKEGQVSIKIRALAKYPDINLKRSYYAFQTYIQPPHRRRLFRNFIEITLENRTPQATPILSEDLLLIQQHFSKPIGRSEVQLYMDKRVDISDKNKTVTLTSPFFSVLRWLWKAVPSFARVPVYDVLVRIGLHIYGPSLSQVVYKLPFGLYLRRGPPSLFPKHNAEAHTLRMLEKSTKIPAPRAIDVLKTPRYSYLLMTCVPGRPIGPQLNTMTDAQVEQVVTDLKRHISQLWIVPPQKTEYLICDSRGDGILDWRIPDSQRETLRFKTEAEFNQYLTARVPDEIKNRAAKSHGTPHNIYFTHGDLNMRNVLAENGKITGIVDWENANWFPEYWEYTKAHYSVRGEKRWLVDVVDSLFDGYREELWAENYLSDAMGPF